VAGAIYDRYEIVDEFPKEIEKVWYGMDFGYTNDPTTLIKVGLQGGEIYAEELVFERRLTNQDIAERFTELKLLGTDEIFADSAEPKSIEEIYRKRFQH